MTESGTPDWFRPALLVLLALVVLAPVFGWASAWSAAPVASAAFSIGSA